MLQMLPFHSSLRFLLKRPLLSAKAAFLRFFCRPFCSFRLAFRLASSAGSLIACETGDWFSAVQNEEGK